MTVEKYRKQHKKCLYCRYVSTPTRAEIDSAAQAGVKNPKWWCRAKLKLINKDFPRPFCRIFEVERKDIESKQPMNGEKTINE